jgi:hypothetical protein
MYDTLIVISAKMTALKTCKYCFRKSGTGEWPAPVLELLIG